MRVLRAYLARELLLGWFLAILVLTAVFTLLLLIDEVDKVSERYTINHALRYLLGTLPQRIIDLAPVSGLLGTLIALGNLARHSELIIMRGAGLSLAALVRNLSVPILALVVALYLLTEYVAAPMFLQAEIERQVARSGKLNLLDSSGLWANDGNRFILVSELHLGQIPQGIEVFNFDSQGRLLSAIQGREAQVSEARKWTLIDVVRKETVNDRLTTTHQASLDIGAVWSEQELPVLALSPAGMSPSDLNEYIDHLDNTGQRSDRMRLVLWQKITLPLSAAAMILLAAPIGAGLGSVRSGNFGLQLALGALLGVGFYMLSQIIHNAGLLLGLPAPLVAGVPLALVLTLAFLLMHLRR